MVDAAQKVGDSAVVSADTEPNHSAQNLSPAPPIRRPVLFYLTVTLAFGILGAAVLALIL